MDNLIGSQILINVLLIFLIVLDIMLSTLCIFFPSTWFKIVHGKPYVDPQGLLRRTGAVWIAFTVLQIIAYLKWEEAPYWLVLIAGVRLTEMFSDWVYLIAAENITWRGRVGLIIAPPSNILFGWFFIESFLKISNGN